MDDWADCNDDDNDDDNDMVTTSREDNEEGPKKLNKAFKRRIEMI